jgi:hypothetical protein
MEAKEILEKVKLFFNDLIAPVEPAPIVAAEPKDYELKGGGTVTIDKLEVGGIVLIDGNSALPGELELTDGTKLTIADNGMIAEVVAGIPVEPVVPELDMAAKFASFETMANEKFANYATKFEAQEIQMGKMNTQLSKANKVIEELLKLSTLIVEAPAANPDPTVRTITNFKEEKEDKKVKSSPILFN